MRYVYAIIGGFIIVVGIAVGWMLLSVNHATGSASQQVSFTVARGQQLRSVAVALQKDNLISSAGAWTLYALTQGKRSGILVGDYVLDRGMTGRQILQTISTQNAKDNEVMLTFKEGLTNKEIASSLETAGVVSASDFLAAVGVTDSRTVVAKDYTFLADKPASADLEGYLFPDTYRFFKKSTAASVLQKFLDNFDQRVTPALRQAAKAHGHTLYEELTMASILEKELKTDTDRANGADVFWKRIDIGMPLQSDATVIFSTGQSNINVSIADTNTDSPYNTYQHKGLPPGTINNPGISSLRAAINPTSNPYYYYLTAPDGTTYFAKTLAEHNENKAKYLK